MAIDLRRFHSTFFEESLESAALMEAELLELERMLRRGDEVAAADPERLNGIFRAAHSIKGGSGTFGFNHVAEFAHALESVLDDARAGRRAIDIETAGLLIRGVDCLRALVQAARDDGPAPSQAEDLRGALERAQASGRPVSPARQAPAPSGNGWRIHFTPHDRFFHTGNDPARILRALAEIGPLVVRPDLARLPAWDRFDPQTCYLGWEVELQKPAARSAVDEAFAWVVDDCALEIQPLAPTGRAEAAPTARTDDPATSSIRVATAKVDGLVDIVGELVITQTMLAQVADGFTPERLPRLRASVEQLARHTHDLQDAVLGIRMLPIGFVFSRLPRLARDVSSMLGKQVELEISGERTEIDKAIIERLSDPLVHLVRNSIDHGIEPPEERVRLGKPAHGTIRLKAYHQAGSVVIEVTDDGRGLDRARIVERARERGLVAADAQLEPGQIDELIFMPGFSTAESVNGVSGRGVGMDVVRSNIRTLGGGVEVGATEGEGTRFVIRLPLTLAIVDGMSLLVGAEIYILPIAWIAETVCATPERVSQPAGGPEIIELRGEYLPLLRLGRLFNLQARARALSEGIVVVVEADGKRAGFFVDELLGQQQVVLKSLEPHCARLEGISAATILGDGTVALILDAGSLVRRAYGVAAGPSDPRMVAGAPLAAASATLH